MHGALWVVRCSRCSNRQLFGKFGEDTRAAGALAPPVSLETDLVGPRRAVRCLLAGSSPLRAVITADCVSQRLALIGLSLSVRWRKEELAFVRLPWRRGHLMRASTL